MQSAKMLCIILVLFCVRFSQSMFGKKKKFQLLKYETCEDHPDLPMRVSGFKSHVYSKNNRSVELTVNVDREISMDMSSVVNLWKCDSSGAPDTCEFYIKDLKITKLCEKMPQKNQGWSDFIDSFQPEFMCPIKKGKYLSKQFLNEEPLRFFPLPIGLWKTKAFMYEKDNVMICCLDFHVKIFEVRE